MKFLIHIFQVSMVETQCIEANRETNEAIIVNVDESGSKDLVSNATGFFRTLFFNI